MTIQSIQEPEALRGMVMIVFTDVADVPKIPEANSPKRTKSSNTQMAQMESELRYAREEIQGIQEEVQASQEELRSANEELQSANEELQSTNEELTTSREEMQSLNEELQTVNNELQAKVSELYTASDDMKNLLNSTDIATVFLDSSLLLRRFTSQATKILRLIPGDIGRPITDISSDLIYSELPDDTNTVLQTLVFTERQITTHDGRWYAVRIMPYRTLDNRIDGVVITLMEITVSKTLEVELRKTAERINNILENTSDAYFSLDKNLRVININSAAQQIMNRTSTAVVGHYFFDIFPEVNGSVFEDKFREVLKEKTPITFDTDLGVGSFAGSYKARISPEAEGISVFFQVRHAQ
jgi:two-component system CheB/CheR fusion protein